jgi:hypothetical protein
MLWVIAMKQNIGTADRIIRIIVGIIVAVVAVMYNLWWLWIFVVVLLGTAVTGWCGLYRLLGISTR